MKENRLTRAVTRFLEGLQTTLRLESVKKEARAWQARLAGASKVVKIKNWDLEK